MIQILNRNNGRLLIDDPELEFASTMGLEIVWLGQLVQGVYHLHGG